MFASCSEISWLTVHTYSTWRHTHRGSGAYQNDWWLSRCDGGFALTFPPPEKNNLIKVQTPRMCVFDIFISADSQYRQLWMLKILWINKSFCNLYEWHANKGTCSHTHSHTGPMNGNSLHTYPCKYTHPHTPTHFPNPFLIVCAYTATQIFSLVS